MAKEETRLQKFKRLFPWADTRYATFDWADPEEYDKVVLTSDVAAVKDELIAEYVTPYGLPWLPGYVLKELVEASQLDNAGLKYEKLKLARDKARNAHLANLASGRIKDKDEVVEPMSDDVKQKLRELNAERKAEKKAKRERVDAIDKVKKIPKVKIPVFNDPDAQAALLAKYPWALAGSFIQEGHNPKATSVRIKCQVCGKERTIGLADLFHVKKCLDCQKAKGKASK